MNDREELIIFLYKHCNEFKQLLSSLRREMRKIEKINPIKLISVTLLNLSSARVRNVKDIFKSFIKDNPDIKIYKKYFFEVLVRKYSKIEKKYFGNFNSSLNL